jgi:hypothetical protein
MTQSTVSLRGCCQSIDLRFESLSVESAGVSYRIVDWLQDI